MMLRLLLLISLCSTAAHAADRVSKATRTQFRAVSAKAAKASPAQAIELYEAALRGSLKDYGRVHLQLGELYLDQKRWADAAWHFRACDADRRVESIDRELVCQGGLKTATAPLEGLPPGSRARILAPKAFAGPVRNGDRVPRGSVELEVTVGGKANRNTLTVDKVARWRPAVSVPDNFVAVDRPRDVPDGFVDEPAKPGFVAAAERPPIAPAGEAIRWPAYAAAGVGAVLLGTGLAIGLGGQSELDDLRAGQRQGTWPSDGSLRLGRLEDDALLADVLIYAGSGLLASAVALWFIFDSDSPDDDSDEDADDAADEDSDDDSDEDADDDSDDDADDAADEDSDDAFIADEEEE